MSVFGKTKKCKCCKGDIYIPLLTTSWVFRKVSNNGKTVSWYCSWTCWRKSNKFKKVLKGEKRK